MNRSLTTQIAALALSLIGCAPADAHINSINRNFGTFSTGAEAPVTFLNTIIVGSWAWADGTDEDYGSSEDLRAYRFTLTYDARVTFDVTATDNGGALLGTLRPGISIYQGREHAAPNRDHDGAPVSGLWRDTQPGVPKEGNFRALGDWKVGNDVGTTLEDLTSFIFQGYAVDGTSANFGPVPGIVGDGVADGHLIATFNLGPGEYTLFVGGATYADQVPGNVLNYGVNVTMMVPEPAAAGLLLPAMIGLLLRRRRR